MPQLPVLRIVSAGNVAGEGAKMALLSVRERAGANALLEEVEYVELSRSPRLQRPFRRAARLQRVTAAIALIACGALVAAVLPSSSPRNGWPVDVHPLPPLLHNQPHLIADEVRTPGRPACWSPAAGSSSATPTAAPTAPSTRCAATSVSSGYRGCTATTCSPAPTGWPSSSRSSPAPTCSPTSWCARSPGPWCGSSAWTATPSCATTTSAPTPASSGWPSEPDPELQRLADEAAATLGLPLTVVETGNDGLERALADLVC